MSDHAAAAAAAASVSEPPSRESMFAGAGRILKSWFLQPFFIGASVSLGALVGLRIHSYLSQHTLALPALGARAPSAS